MDYRGPSTDEMREILGRLRQELARDGLRRDELLQVEMTLRGMLPDLEAQLQRAIDDGPERDGVEAAVQGLMAMSANLMWIQLHAGADDDTVRSHVNDGVEGAERALTLC